MTTNMLPIHIVFCKNLQLKCGDSYNLPWEVPSRKCETAARSTYCFIRVLKIIDELNFSWDPGIISVFSGTTSTIFYACAFSDLSTAADPSRRPISHAPPWFVLDHDCGFLGHRYGPIEILRVRGPHLTRLSFSHPGEMVRTSLCLLVYYYALIYF